MKLADKFKPQKSWVMWSNGKIVKAPHQISSMSYPLHYGAPVIWEGVRSYKTADGSTQIFSLNEHIKRLFDSAKSLGVKVPFDFATLVEATRSVVEANGGGDLYIRPVVYLDKDAKSISPDDTGTVRAEVYVFPITPHKGVKPGIRTAISTFTRGYPQFQMQIKNSSNYSFMHHCKLETEMFGVDDMLLTDNQGYITEATVANIFIVKNGVVYTPPNNGSILPGITRANIARLLTRDTRLSTPTTILEKNLTKTDVYTADEIFICGTYVEVIPVVEVDKRVIGNGKPGDVTTRVQWLYSQLVRGYVHNSGGNDK